MSRERRGGADGGGVGGSGRGKGKGGRDGLGLEAHGSRDSSCAYFSHLRDAKDVFSCRGPALSRRRNPSPIRSEPESGWMDGSTQSFRWHWGSGTSGRGSGVGLPSLPCLVANANVDACHSTTRHQRIRHGRGRGRGGGRTPSSSPLQQPACLRRRTDSRGAQRPRSSLPLHKTSRYIRSLLLRVPPPTTLQQLHDAANRTDDRSIDRSSPPRKRIHNRVISSLPILLSTKTRRDETGRDYTRSDQIRSAQHRTKKPLNRYMAS
ncbi:hypothetical protein MPTK1_3g25095 [Marchantia polymorpha subsp. ruderalis]